MDQVWAIVEIMGHVRVAGILTEEEKFGCKVGRIEIPQEDGTFATRYFGGQAVYQIHIVSEEVARQAAKVAAPAPMNKWDFPKALVTSSANVQPNMKYSDEDGADVEREFFGSNDD